MLSTSFLSCGCVLFQSNDNEERLQVVKLLAKMFGAKDSELASQNKPLWQCYLGRYMILVSFKSNVCLYLHILF